MLNNKLYLHHDNEGYSGGVDDHEHKHGLTDEDMIIQIVDPDSGETFDFYLGDEFDYEDNLYYVLIPIDEAKDPVYAITRVVEEDGEAFVETLTDEENEVIYEVYNKILEDYFANEDLEESD